MPRSCAAADASAALTPGQYRAQASAICAKTKSRIAAIQPSPLTVTRARGTALLAERLVVTRDEYTAFRALKAPASLAAAHSKILWDMWKLYNADAKLVQQLRSGAGDAYTLDSNEMMRTSSFTFDLWDRWREVGVSSSCSSADSISMGWSN